MTYECEEKFYVSREFTQNFAKLNVILEKRGRQSRRGQEFALWNCGEAVREVQMKVDLLTSLKELWRRTAALPKRPSKNKRLFYPKSQLMQRNVQWVKLRMYWRIKVLKIERHTGWPHFHHFIYVLDRIFFIPFNRSCF